MVIPLNIQSFFLESKEVWVSDNFKNIFLAQYIESKGDESLLKYDNLTLQNIKPDHNLQSLVFEDSDIFLEQLCKLIKKQITGENGELLNDSSANYFFVLGKDKKHYSILVRWEHSQKLWRCGAYLQEDLKLPNIKIFYPTQK